MIASTDAFPLVDVTADSGLAVHHQNGAQGDRWLPETMGAGVCVLDANGDHRPDLFFPGGHAWDSPAATSALYLATGPLTYQRAPTTFPVLVAMGAVAADLDGDGHQDLVITGLEASHVLWGDGTGRFADGGKVLDGWGTSACVLDADADGALDVFVGRYVEWTPATDLWCSIDGEEKTYCTPELYPASTNVLLRNLGGRRFRAESQPEPAKALGVVADDFNHDGWTDVFVGNDTLPDNLYLNQGDGTFRDVGLPQGIALSSSGRARAGMGVDTADYRRSGRPGVAVGHFAGEVIGLYRNDGPHGFLDEAAALALANGTMGELTFGLVFADLDNDGWPDLITANGHIEPRIAQIRPTQSYRQPLGIYRNLEGKRFASIPPPEPVRALVGRGLVAADLDNDGDPDLVVTQNGGGPRLLRNDQGNPALRVDVADGAGARVIVTVDQELRQATVHVGHSYLSGGPPSVIFGLGGSRRVTRVEVTWPGGEVTSRTLDLDATATHVLSLVRTP